uniref:Uncharacterized protein n=1 Tax=Zea mays TaxID=4577 RepID=C4J354_MAIZE|nr:unknown [Zea mays]
MSDCPVASAASIRSKNSLTNFTIPCTASARLSCLACLATAKLRICVTSVASAAAVSCPTSRLLLIVNRQASALFRSLLCIARSNSSLLDIPGK